MGTAADRSPAAMRAGPLRHEALAHSSPDELAHRLTGPVGSAVAAGEVVVAVLEDAVRHRLEEDVGPPAAGVEFLSPAAVHTVPGFTTAVRWARRSRNQNAPAVRTLIIAQQLPGLNGCGTGYWTRLCLGLEVAGSGLPLTVLCPFRDDAEGWARVRQTHSVLGTDGGYLPNPDYRPPAEVVAEHPLPPRTQLGSPSAELDFVATDLGALRHLTAEIAALGGLGPDRIDDAVLAVNELASNSIEHGAGSGRLQLWAGGAPGMVAEVADGGRLTDPFPGMVHPDTGGSRGRGLWLASELCDVMEVWTEDGTVVRVSWLG